MDIQNRPETGAEQLRQALDAKTIQRLELQQQLDRANTEFEEFVSMAAHNLRESLREVGTLSQLVAETSAGQLDSAAAESLERIRESAARAQALLTGIVDYWAPGGAGLKFSRTEMEAVLCQAALCIGNEIAERKATITHDPLPAVMGDFGILTKVMKHLIRNAIEYCEVPSPQIHIASEFVNGEWVLSVRDNGPGIDPAFQSRLFRAFKRLHGKEHPGNGLGLAYCRKVIGWHGGRIWLESEPGAGATFHFTLPPA